MKCDLCHADDPCWRYPARSFVSNLTDDDFPLGIASHGDWALCNRCALYLETGKTVELAIIAADVLAADLPPDADYEYILACMVKLHSQFRANRTGPCQPIEERMFA